jgi:hypothetical protein
MNLKTKVGCILTTLFSPFTASICFTDGIQDTQTIEAINGKRLITLSQNQLYSEHQFGSTLGELEHSSHAQSFSTAWPETEEVLRNVPTTIEGSLSGSALLGRLGSVGASTLEVLGPVGDTVAVGLWVENMVSTFASESTSRLDKVASIFSILPLVGDELNLLSNDIKYFAAKDKIAEFENQTHDVFSSFHSESSRFHHRKEDAIALIKKYDRYLVLAASMYVDHLLLTADTEFRRIASAYDRQLARQMARMDLEFLKTLGYISPDTNLHQPLCQDVASDSSSLRSCIQTKGPQRISHIIQQLNSSEHHDLSLKIYKAKKSLVEVALNRLTEQRARLINQISERAKPHITTMFVHSSLNRSNLEYQARKSSLREYAKEAWDIDYLTEEQLKTATFEVQPARICWGVPSVYPGGIQASIDACKDSGALYDTYHIQKDPELVLVINERVSFDVEKYVTARIIRGWPEGLLNVQLKNLAQNYIIGQKSNQVFESLLSRLSTVEVADFQTSLGEYLVSKGLDGSDPKQRKNWYQISRWYELILTERPRGGILSNITQYEIFHGLIQPIFEEAIAMAFIRDSHYIISFPSVYSAKNLRFLSPIMADIFDESMTKPASELDDSIEQAIALIMEKVAHTNTANELQYLLGDLSLYVQIAQHQQSEVNTGTLNGNNHQLFASTLSRLHTSYLLESHQQEIEQQIGYVKNHSLWIELLGISATLGRGDLDMAINQLGQMIRHDELTMLPYIDELLLQELEQWIELQIVLEGIQ